MDQQSYFGKEISLEQLKEAYQSYHEGYTNCKQTMEAYQRERQFEMNKINLKLANQERHFERINADKNKRIDQLQQTIKRIQAEDNEKSRRQIRKYIEQINEKDAQIINLRKLITISKTKISKLDDQIDSLNNVNENYDIFIVKGLEQLKNMKKEINNNMDQVDTQKMVLQSKFRQRIDNVHSLHNRLSEIELRLKSQEQNHGRLRETHKYLKEESINQKFQIQKLKQTNPNYFSLDSFDKAQVQCSLQSSFFKFQALNQILIKEQDFIIQLDRYHSMNASLIQENKGLKQAIQSLNFQLQDLKCKYVSNYENQLMKERQPSLYEFLMGKKQEYQRFENTIEKIENYIESKDEVMTGILKKMMSREMGCSCGKKQDYDKLNQEFESLTKRNEYLQESNLKMRIQNSNFNKTVQNYKVEIKELLVSDGNKKNRKKNTKKRCLNCFFNIERQKSENLMKCQDCNQTYHNACIAYHNCHQFKLQEGTSFMSGAND